MIKKTLLLIAACAISGCGKKSTPEDTVMAFFEHSRNATQSNALSSYFTGPAAAELDDRFRNIQSMHENYELSLSILDKAEQEDGTVRLKTKIEWSDDSGKGSMQEVFTLSGVAGEWKIVKIGGPFEDLGLEELKDSQGKTPFDYAGYYFEAMNEDDLAALESLLTKGYYDRIVTNRGSLEEPEPDRFISWVKRKIKKTEAHELRPEESGFLDSNAEGVYSTSYKITFTDSFAKEFGDKYLKGKIIKSGGLEVCFRLEDGIWRITDKNEGY